MVSKAQKVYLLRHGETEWSLSGQHTGRTDIALTTTGILEAKAIKGAIAGVKFAKVYTSPLQRASKTAELAGFTNIEQDPDLLEWNYGKYDGMKTIDIIKENPAWNIFDSGAPGGEQASEVGKRADRVIAKIRSQDGDVAIISHAHYLRVFAARWLNLNPHYGKLLYLNTASISIIGYEHNDKEPVIKMWNSTDHLKSHA